MHPICAVATHGSNEDNSVLSAQMKIIQWAQMKKILENSVQCSTEENSVLSAREFSSQDSNEQNSVTVKRFAGSP